MTQPQLMDVLEDSGLGRDARTLRRWLEVLREAGFGISRSGGRYELRSSPVRIPFTGHEALATLSLLESLAVRDPVYGDHLISAVAKLREALPEQALKFADAGRSSSPWTPRATRRRTRRRLMRSAALLTRSGAPGSYTAA